jgi:hypothetical protein
VLVQFDVGSLDELVLGRNPVVEHARMPAFQIELTRTLIDCVVKALEFLSDGIRLSAMNDHYGLPSMRDDGSACEHGWLL